LPGYDEDSLPDEIWLSALLGLGVLPRDIQPVAAVVDPVAAAARMAEMRAGLAQLPARVPGFAEYLARVAEPPR
jgi:tryptophan halogenase